MFLGAGLFATSMGALAEWGLNLPPPVTPIAAEILDLHNLIMLICLIIFIVVFSFMFYSVYAHRKSKGFKAAQFHESTTVEIVWTIIPFLILVGMAIPSTATLIRMEDTTDADLTVKITGYQWKWGYEYMGQDVSFFSNLATPADQILNRTSKGEHYLLEVDKPVVLPTNQKVRFLLTASDVIHSWWVPKLGVKKDAIPGYINETWTYISEPGVYRGQCTELCGKDHGFMPIVVEAKSPEDFAAWLAEQKQAQAADAEPVADALDKDELLARGADVYQNCVACHGTEGKGVPGIFPAIHGSEVVNGPVEQHLDVVMNGKPGTAMHPFKNQLSDLDIAAVITYQRNSLGNENGDVVQPSQVHALR
ncbi:MAG: cytochrome c oxidase subunit II [Gammaproteobacteria bacterium]|nr:cytochrome c oxidase subunit II [Gammaproteobacteria bacterium]